MRTRRLVPIVFAVLLGLASTACEPLPPGEPIADLPKAPAPVPPTALAPAGSWRAAGENWVRDLLYLKVLGRAGGTPSVLSWGDRVVRTSPAGVANTFAATAEGRRRAVAFAFGRILLRQPTTAEGDYWVGQLGAGWTIDRMVGYVAGSGEVSNAFPSNPAWLNAVFQRVLGRSPDASAQTHFLGRLEGGESRTSVAGSLVTSAEARRRVVTTHYTEVLGGAPSTARRDQFVTRLGALAGNETNLRAEIAVLRAPAPLRVGVVGDSVAWDLAAHVTVPLPAIVTGGANAKLVNGGYLGCGVISPLAGYYYRYTDGSWYQAGDGACTRGVIPQETTMLDKGIDVVVWPIGGWEHGDVRKPDGSVVAARSTAMRDLVAGELIRRIDWYSSRGVKRVVFPEWACIRSTGVIGTTAYSQFIRSVLDRVVAARPNMATIAPTTPQVCVGGNPTAKSTFEHASARDVDGVHWLKGATGAAWAWNNWLDLAIANVTNVGR